MAAAGRGHTPPPAYTYPDGRPYEGAGERRRAGDLDDPRAHKAHRVNDMDMEREHRRVVFQKHADQLVDWLLVHAQYPELITENIDAFTEAWRIAWTEYETYRENRRLEEIAESLQRIKKARLMFLRAWAPLIQQEFDMLNRDFHTKNFIEDTQIIKGMITEPGRVGGSWAPTVFKRPFEFIVIERCRAMTNVVRIRDMFQNPTDAQPEDDIHVVLHRPHSLRHDPPDYAEPDGGAPPGYAVVERAPADGRISIPDIPRLDTRPGPAGISCEFLLQIVDAIAHRINAPVLSALRTLLVQLQSHPSHAAPRAVLAVRSPVYVQTYIETIIKSTKEFAAVYNTGSVEFKLRIESALIGHGTANGLIADAHALTWLLTRVIGVAPKTKFHGDDGLELWSLRSIADPDAYTVICRAHDHLVNCMHRLTQLAYEMGDEATFGLLKQRLRSGHRQSTEILRRIPDVEGVPDAL